MATLAHVELTKIQKLLQRKIKNKNENQNENENEIFLNFTMTSLDHYTFVNFKKREKHPWRGVTFSKVAG